MPVSILVWLLVVLMRLGPLGLTGVDVDTAEPAPSEPAPEVPQEFLERSSLPACGLVGQHGTAPARAWGCLADGLGVDGAELVSLPTDDGTSTYTYYRALPDGRLEIWTQTTRLEGTDLRSAWSFRECRPSQDLRRQPCAS